MVVISHSGNIITRLLACFQPRLYNEVLSHRMRKEKKTDDKESEGMERGRKGGTNKGKDRNRREKRLSQRETNSIKPSITFPEVFVLLRYCYLILHYL